MNMTVLQGKALLFSLALAALPVGMTSSASAAVVSSFSVAPTSILEGGFSTLHLNLALDDEPPLMEFKSGSVTLFSGLGTSSVFSIVGGGRTLDFLETFSYPSAGKYTPSFSFVAIFGIPGKPPEPSQCANDCSVGGFVNLTVTATPVPAALPLFGTGIGLMGLLGWWRQRRAEITA